MLQDCLNCGNPISDYPCKFCGYKLSIPDKCARFQMGRCITTKKLCPNPKNYINCKVFDQGN